MRTLRVFGLALSIALLLLGSIAEAQVKSPPRKPVPGTVKVQTVGDPGGQPATIDVSATPDPLEFFFFFRYLASLDAAADQALAEGNPGAVEWKSLDQREAGLTDEQGAIVKAVAYACNQTLSEPSPAEQPAGRTEVVSAAMDELRSRLGEETFQLLAAYVHDKLGPGLDEVSGVPGPVPPGTITGDSEPPPETLAVAAEINVSTLITKLSGFQTFAMCDTAMDAATAQYYPRTLTFCGLFGDDGSQFPVPCDTSFPGQCTGIIPSFPGTTYQVQGAHNLVLYPGSCNGSPGVLDPLHYCKPYLEYFNIGGTLYPLGDEVCWPPLPPYNACGLAQTAGRFIAFIGLYPFDATLYAGQQQRFAVNIPATLSLIGPGQLAGNLYTAPSTITSPQTATVVACDADPNYRTDCLSSTIHLQPLQVDLTPGGEEVLPGASLDFKATVTPSTEGLTVEWTLEDPTEAASIVPDENDSTKATFFAPEKEDITDTQEITVKACVKPNPSTQACATAKVRVPQIEIILIANPATHTLGGNQTIQFTAVISGSNKPYRVQWIPYPEYFDGGLTVDTPDSLVATYKAPSLTRGSVSIRACLGLSDVCSQPYELNIVDPVRIDSVTGDFTAGQTDSTFTITGTGFGVLPKVTVNGLEATVVSAADSLITCVINLPISMGGTPVSITVKATSGPTVFFPNFNQTSPTIAPISRLGVSPAAAEVRQGGSQPFSAICLTAKGAICNSSDAVLVHWTASQGTIDPLGPSVLYRAPASVPASTTATVTACWGSQCAPSAVVTLLPPPVETAVTVSPKTATVRVGQTQPFTATVMNNTNTAVTWSIQPSTPGAGSINQSGLYTAPATFGGVTTVTVIATSQADGTKSDTATVTLFAPPTISVTPSPPSANPGTTITWTVTVSGGSPATYQYAIFRRRVGAPAWIPDQTAPAWQTSNVFTWTPSSSDTGNWEILIWVKDDSTPPNIYPVNPGNVQIATPITSLTCTPSPAAALYGNAINWTATPNGGIPASTQYALFRRRAGATDWTPLVTAPNWQSNNPLSWTPASTDAGTWEIIVWAKDGTTPPTQNTYGYAAYCNPGPVRVVGPLSVTSTSSPAAAYSGTAITWTATASGGDAPTTQFALVRKPAGTATWLPATPVWQTGGSLTWTPASGETGNWDIAIRVKDVTTPANPGYAAQYNPGQVQVVPPLTLTGTASPASASYGNTITWTLTANGGTGVNRQYAFFRRRAGTTPWTPDVTAAAWQSSNVFNWTPGSTDTGTWEIIFWAKDSATPATMNTYGYAAYFNAGPVQIVPPLTVTSTGSPAASLYGNAITWTASITGGVPASAQYALFRRRAGVTAWTPDVTVPAWQTSNPLSWTPASTDVGTWEIIIWAKDGTTPPTLNTYGYASYCNPGPVRVVAPLGVTSTPSPAAAYYGTAISWTATASGGDAPTTQYAFSRRRVGTPDWIPSTAVWQTSNSFSWTPTAADAGSWETTIVVRDVTTPPTANGGYGYAAITSPGVVQVVTPPSLSVTASPAWSLSGNAITWTATASGGTGTNVQYAFFRRRSGTTPWTPSVTAPSWQASRTYGWTPSATDAGNWDVYVWVKDSATTATMNTYGYAAGANPGGVQVVAPMTVSGTGSPSPVYSGTTITWTANASGNTPSTTRYALFRRRLGTTPWTPDVTAPAWQSSNTLSWTPSSTDTGTWEIIIWAKDGNTPANMNTYGYAAYYNAGTVQVVTPPTVSGTGSPSSAYYGPTLTWTANVSGGTGTGIRYAFFRRRSGTTPWTPDVTAAAWQTSNTMSWTPTSADVGTWEIIIWAKDSATPSNMNTYGFATYYNAGPVQIVAPAPLTVSGTGSPSTSPYGTSISWTANASGGVPSTIKYALFRKLAGTSNWIPDVTAPAWQTSNVLRWTPSASDVGTWEIIIWVKDINTSPTQNTYGFAAYYNAQPVQVVSP